MPLIYKHTKENKRQSIIKHNGKTFRPLTSKPSAGWAAYTRFFGTIDNERNFVVKQPKPNSRTGTRPLDIQFKSSYEKEHEIWNSAHPEHPAELVIEGGLRLILPYLPGKPLSEALVNDRDDLLIYSQQVLAIVKEIKRFHDLGWEHNDLRLGNDNMLLEKKDNHYRAYIIDFDRASKKADRNNTDWVFIDSLVYGIPNLRTEKFNNSFELLITALEKEINYLQEEKKFIQINI